VPPSQQGNLGMQRPCRDFTHGQGHKQLMGPLHPLQGNMTGVFGGLDALQFLQMLDLSDCAGLQGPLVPPGVQQDSGLCLLATRLQVLNLAEIGECTASEGVGCLVLTCYIQHAVPAHAPARILKQQQRRWRQRRRQVQQQRQ
jgi:hypothetical protein